MLFVCLFVCLFIYLFICCFILYVCLFVCCLFAVRLFVLVVCCSFVSLCFFCLYCVDSVGVVHARWCSSCRVRADRACDRRGSCCAGRARSYSCWSCSFCPHSCCSHLLLLVLLAPVLTGVCAAVDRAHSPLPRFLLRRAVPARADFSFGPALYVNAGSFCARAH